MIIFKRRGLLALHAKFVEPKTLEKLKTPSMGTQHYIFVYNSEHSIDIFNHFPLSLNGIHWPTMQKLSSEKQAWLVLLSFSVGFFVVTAATFTSLGVVLPAMVSELKWDWTTAGLGFTFLGVACGLSGYLPTVTIRRLGMIITLLIGVVLMSAGFMLLYATVAPMTYFLGCALAGAGYTFIGAIPGSYIITHFFTKRSTAFGIYYTLGGFGGVVGPQVVWLATDVLGSWRIHWLVMMAAIVIATLMMLGSLLFTEREKLTTPPIDSASEEAPRVYVTKESWTFAEAVKTPQYFTLCVAYIAVLFIGITVNSFSVAHLTEAGISFALAGILLSFEAFFNAISRVVGGVIGEFVEPNRLLQAALLLLALGMFSLTFGQSMITLSFYALAIGFGFGLTFLSVNVLLVRYFGAGPYLPLFSLMNVCATLASFAPLVAGRMRDITGTFIPPFVMIGLLPIVVLVAVFRMRPPSLKKTQSQRS